MSEILTITQVEKWIYEKLNNNKNPPKGWEEQINNSIKMKEELIAKAEKTFESEIPKLKLQVKHLKELKYFLNYNSMGVPFDIHPAGIIQKGCLIEPIASWKYVYNLYGLKGIVQVQVIPETRRYYIEVEGNQIYLKGNPIEEFSFELPNEELIRKWTKNEIGGPAIDEIWKELENHFRTFLDIPEVMYKACVLFTFQTYLQEMLETVFYLAILGHWGAGKSTILKSLCEVAYRGVEANSSVAVIARDINDEKCRLFFDEIDSTINNEEDNEKLSIIRQGYQKGAKHKRMAKDSNRKISYNVYGTKAFNAHTEIEPALLQRCIPITTVESTDATVPVINSIRKKVAKMVKERLYLWFLDSILFNVDSVCSVDYIYNDNNNIRYNRDTMYDTLAEHIGSTGVTCQQYGRSGEIAFVMANLAKLMGVVIDEKWSTEIFEIKRQVEDEQKDIGPISILRDILVEKYKEYAPMPNSYGWRTPEGDLKMANKYIYDEFNHKLKNEKSFGCSPHEFVGYLRELGFDAGGRRKIRIKIPNETIDLKGESPVRVALVYIPIVLRKLGIEAIESIKIEQEKIKKEYKGDYKEDD